MKQNDFLSHKYIMIQNEESLIYKINCHTGRKMSICAYTCKVQKELKRAVQAKRSIDVKNSNKYLIEEGNG